MQPYVNPNYFGYNNYLMNMPQANNGNSYVPQMQMQNSFATGMSGRVVNDFAEITANDVPMDGRKSFFPKADGSEIQVREWSPNGQIISTLYKPYIEPKETKTDILSTETKESVFDAKSEVLEPIFARLEQLESKIDKISRTSASTKSKKEVADES